MCFSTEIETDLNKLVKIFDAKISDSAYKKFDQLLKIQLGANGPEKIKEIFNQKRKSKQFIQVPGNDGRVYPNYFAPVMIMESERRVFRPMRYRIRPNGSLEEIPSKYNVFNARLDALEKRITWSGIFMRKHALFPFKSFFEWVTDDNGKKRLIQFTPKSKEIIWAPALWDSWTSADSKISIDSFAIITDEPPSEVAAMGHDRCPIFMSESCIDRWLSPQRMSKEEIYDLLMAKEDVYYKHRWAA